MSSHPTNFNSGRSRPTSDSHSSQLYPDQGRTTLPPLTIAFPTSNSPVPNNYICPYPTQQRPTSAAPPSPQQHYYQPAQPQTQVSCTYSPYPPPPSEQPRHYGSQAYGSHNGDLPSFGSADPRRHSPPPLEVPRELEGWQGQGSQYYSNRDDMRSPHAACPTSSYPPHQAQHQSLSATTYPAGHNRGSPPPVAAGASQQYHQHRPMSVGQRTMPSPRTSTQLPGTEEVVLLGPTEPVIKEKRKRANGDQMEVLKATYARTAYPSTEERAALAKALDMSARSVQTWFQDKRQHSRQGGRNVASTSSNPVTVPPPVHMPTPSAGYRGSPMSVSPMVETPGPTFSSPSPLPSTMRSVQTPSPPQASGRPDNSVDWPRNVY